MEKQPLTKSQQKVFDALVKFLNEGTVPTIRDLCDETGFTSTSTIHLHLNSLRNKGYIEKDDRLNRTLRLAGDVHPGKVPVVGKVRAGKPILAAEEIIGYLPVSKSISDNAFALKVVGDSMIKAGIFENDTLIIKRDAEINNGDIVVALIDDKTEEGQATVKRYYKVNEKVMLEPENDNYDPIVVLAKDCQVLGKVVSLIRDM